MNVMEQAILAFESRPVKEVAVPEWSADPAQPVVIYFKTPNAKTLAKVQAEAGANAMEQAARLVAIVAMDSAGNRLFTDAGYTDLMIRTDPRGLMRAYTAILADARIDVTAAEKN